MRTVSVIIPAYNRAAYIEEAIQSVLDQELPKGYALEVIVVDDGSTDDTVQRVKRFKSGVILIEAVHSGKPAVPRNIGLRSARGELIAFQDSDDAWAPGKLRAQLPVFKDPQVMVSFGNAEIMDANGVKSGKTYLSTRDLLDGESLQGLLTHNVISTLTVMVRKTALDRLGSYFNESDELRAVEDYELWLRLAAEFPRGFRAVPKTLTYYRMHTQNISLVGDLQALERVLSAVESARDSCPIKRQPAFDARLVELRTNWVRLKNELSPGDKPKVSVVMGVYNGGEHLKRSIEGILSQTFTDFEFMIIDDGSTDKSAALIKKFKDPRIRLIRQPNHGLVYTLNKGVQLARGTYIARQDADDISHPTRLEKEVALLDADPSLGLVGSFFTYINESTREPGITICMPTKSLDIKRALYITNPIGHGTAMFRKSIFDTTGYYTNAYGPTEDFELWRRVAEHWEMTIIPESLYDYLINPHSVSHTKAETQHANTAKIIDEQWAKPFKNKPASAIIADGQYYKSMDSPFASLTFDQYAAHQIDIGKALLDRGALKHGALTAYAAIRLKPRSYSLFIQPAYNGLLRRLGLKQR